MEIWARVAFCGLLSVAQILASAHGALVSHRTCPEHGEAIHASSRPTAPPMVRPIVAQATPAFAVDARSLGVEGHEHEHCGSMAHGRAKPAMPLPTWGGLLAQPVVTTWADSAPSLSPGVALFALAPKGSPPVA
jgi:hypothetical protein